MKLKLRVVLSISTTFLEAINRAVAAYSVLLYLIVIIKKRNILRCTYCIIIFMFATIHCALCILILFYVCNNNKEFCGANCKSCLTKTIIINLIILYFVVDKFRDGWWWHEQKATENCTLEVWLSNYFSENVEGKLCSLCLCRYVRIRKERVKWLLMTYINKQYLWLNSLCYCEES